MSREMYETRLADVRARLGEWQVDGVLIGSPSNRRWLSGFTGTAGWLLVTAETALLATDFRYWEQAEEQAPHFTLYRLYRTKNALEEFIAAGAVPQMGIEAKHLTVHDYRRFQKVDDVEWQPLPATVESLREVKTGEEIEQIRRAAAITDAAMAQVPALAQAGLSEKALAWQLERRMREAGADGMAFPVTVASGPNAARPHHAPGDRALQLGDTIIVDMGAAVDGYCADLTRSFHLGGKPAEKFWDVYNLTLKAHETAVTQMKAGMSGQEIDGLARSVIEAGGHGEDFGHSLGHGVGLEVHEGPSLGRTSEDATPAGSVVTVEPGIYLSGWGGIRIEDLVLLTADGAEMISTCPKTPVIHG